MAEHSSLFMDLKTSEIGDFLASGKKAGLIYIIGKSNHARRNIRELMTHIILRGAAKRVVLIKQHYNFCLGLECFNLRTSSRTVSFNYLSIACTTSDLYEEPILDIGRMMGSLHGINAVFCHCVMGDPIIADRMIKANKNIKALLITISPLIIYFLDQDKKERISIDTIEEIVITHSTDNIYYSLSHFSNLEPFPNIKRITVDTKVIHPYIVADDLEGFKKIFPNATIEHC